MKFVFTVTATLSSRVGDDYVETIREEIRNWIEDAGQGTVYFEDNNGTERERSVEWNVIEAETAE